MRATSEEYVSVSGSEIGFDVDPKHISLIVIHDSAGIKGIYLLLLSVWAVVILSAYREGLRLKRLI